MDDMLIGEQDPQVFDNNENQNVINFNNDDFNTPVVPPVEKFDMETQTDPMETPSAEFQCQTDDLPTRVGICQTNTTETAEEDC